MKTSHTPVLSPQLSPESSIEHSMNQSTEVLEAAKTDPSLFKALESAKASLEKKAENVKILELSKLSGFTDYFVICNGTSDRQVQAIADSVTMALESNGAELLSSEGYSEGRWILLDFGDVVVHVFLDALREYYDLEKLWADAPRVRIPSEYYGSGASRLN